MLPSGNKILSPAAAIALLCFFLPWLLISCEGQTVASMSGWQLMVGDELKTSFGAETMEGDAELFLLFAAPIGVLVLAFLVYQNRMTIRSATWGSLGLAVASLLLLYVKFSDVHTRAAEAGLTVKLRYGFWGTVIAHIAILIGALWNLVEGPSLSTITSQRGQSRAPMHPRERPQGRGNPPRRR